MIDRNAGVQLKSSPGFNAMMGGVNAGFIVMLIVSSFRFGTLLAMFGLLIVCVSSWSWFWYLRNPSVVVGSEGVCLLAPARSYTVRFQEIESWRYEKAAGGTLCLKLRSGKTIRRSAGDDKIGEFEDALLSVGIPRVE